MFGDFPAKNTVYIPYIYMVLANPMSHVPYIPVMMAGCPPPGAIMKRSRKSSSGGKWQTGG